MLLDRVSCTPLLPCVPDQQVMRNHDVPLIYSSGVAMFSLSSLEKLPRPRLHDPFFWHANHFHRQKSDFAVRINLRRAEAKSRPEEFHWRDLGLARRLSLSSFQIAVDMITLSIGRALALPWCGPFGPSASASLGRGTYIALSPLWIERPSLSSLMTPTKACRQSPLHW